MFYYMFTTVKEATLELPGGQFGLDVLFIVPLDAMNSLFVDRLFVDSTQVTHTSSYPLLPRPAGQNCCFESERLASGRSARRQSCCGVCSLTINIIQCNFFKRMISVVHIPARSRVTWIFCAVLCGKKILRVDYLLGGMKNHPTCGQPAETESLLNAVSN